MPPKNTKRQKVECIDEQKISSCLYYIPNNVAETRQYEIISNYLNNYYHTSFNAAHANQIQCLQQSRLQLSNLSKIIRVSPVSLKQYLLGTNNKLIDSLSFLGNNAAQIQQVLLQFQAVPNSSKLIKLSQLPMFEERENQDEKPAKSKAVPDSESEEAYRDETKQKGARKSKKTQINKIEEQQIIPFNACNSYNAYIMRETFERREYILAEHEYKLQLAKMLAEQCVQRLNELKASWFVTKTKKSKFSKLSRQIPQLNTFLSNQGAQLKQIQNDIQKSAYYTNIRKQKIGYYLQKTNNMCEQISQKVQQLPSVQPYLLDTQQGTLRPYQIYGMKFLVACTELNLNCLLADDLGLGKSLQTIALLSYLAGKGIHGPHLIVVPSTLIYNWQQEFSKWAPFFNVVVYYGSKAEREQIRNGWSYENHSTVILTSYNLAVIDLPIFKRKNFYYLILDEAHLIRNSKSKAWNSLLEIKSLHKLLISGTPISNSSSDIWSLLHFVLPGLFSSKTEFLNLFSRDIERMADGELAVNRKVIKWIHQLLRPFMLRRLKSEVESELPTKSEFIVPCPLTRQQLYLYSEFMNASETKKSIKGGNYMGVVNVLTNLRKICNHPRLLEDSQVFSAFVCQNGAWEWHGIGQNAVSQFIEGTDQDYRIFREFEDLNPKYLSAEQQKTLLKITQPYQHLIKRKRQYKCGCCGQTKPLLRTIRLRFSDIFNQSERETEMQVQNLIKRLTHVEVASSKELRHFSRKQLDFEIIKSDYQQSLFTYSNLVQNYKYEFNTCCNSALDTPSSLVDCLLPKHNKISNNISDQYFINTFKFAFNSEQPIIVFNPEIERSCFNFQAGRDNYVARGSAWSFHSVSSQSYMFDINPNIQQQQCEPQKFSSWDQHLNQVLFSPFKQQPVVVNNFQRSIQYILNKPIYTQNMHALLFDPAIQGISMLSNIVYSQFLNSKLIKKTPFKMLQLLNINHKIELKMFKFVMHKALLNFNTLSGYEPTFIGQFSNSNLFINSLNTFEQRKLKNYLCEQVIIPYPNSVYLQKDKMQRMQLNTNIKLMKQYKMNQFYSVEHNQELFDFKAHYIYKNRFTQQQLQQLGYPSTPDTDPVDSPYFPPQIQYQQTKEVKEESTTQNTTTQVINKLFRSTKRALPQPTLLPTPRTLLHYSVPKLGSFSQVNFAFPEQLIHRNPTPTLPTFCGRSCNSSCVETNANTFGFNSHQFQFSKKFSPFQLYSQEQFYYIQDCVHVNEADQYNIFPFLNYKLLNDSQSFYQVNNVAFELKQREQIQFEDKTDLIQQSGKLIILQKLLQTLFSQNSRVLIFTQQHKMLDILELFLNHQKYHFFRMDGSSTPKQRINLVNQFNTNLSIFAFIMTTRTGGIGLNLTGADCVVFVDTDWNPQIHQQATDRVHRINQIKPVKVYTMLSEYTCEENIVRRATQKKHLDKLILRDGAFLPEYFDKNAQTFQDKVEKRFFKNETEKIDLVFVNLINQDQLKQRLGDVLDAYQDDDDKQASKELLKEFQGDAEDIQTEGDQETFTESSKQIIDQLNIYSTLEKIPQCYFKFFETGYNNVKEWQPDLEEEEQILGFSKEALDQIQEQEDIEQLKKQFIIHDVDRDAYKAQVEDLNNYAIHELQEDVKELTIQKKKVVKKAEELQIRKLWWQGK
ncbi:SNF2_family helicase [Hexamita inflata]|uniref:Chromatin-remodeling ATPase INO80 n=1 Tax=Hexamita inflata TaxID=28002 RepID=A0AA86Q9K7_9EUKA|nr:SNF2 family helicase [Hexamita inflata]